jgi:NAD(P)-dependent dehydrogenase (short-subunit alcohol dehydrogenase family)
MTIDLVHFSVQDFKTEFVVEECRKKGVDAEAIQGDFSSKEGIAGLIRQIEKQSFQVENLINNVGNFFTFSSLDTPVELWRDLFETNLHAPFTLIQALISSIKLHQGSIINIGTAGAMDFRADIKYTAYTITKKSLYLLTKSLARELAKDHVRVNMVSPGELDNSISLSQGASSLPMQRPASLLEVVRTILFLLNKDSAYITGQNIEVAGGYAL